MYYLTMDVCIVCIAKNENLYINEWIDHHLKIGIDHIYVCDNNDIDGENIKDVVKNKHVTIHNYRGVKCVQPKAYTECFLQYRSQYDWLIFIDIDEFIMIDDKFNNIKEFISSPIFKDVDIIRLNWKLYSGEEEFDTLNNYNVLNRLTNSIDHKENNFGKSIINSNIQYIGGEIYGHGYFENKNLKVVNAIGGPALNEWSTVSNVPIYTNAWINHYPTKTISEYINQKYFRGGANNNNSRYSTLDYFFKYNNKNDDIIKYAENKIRGMC